MPTQPAILGKARLNNFRLAYLPAALAKLRQTTVRWQLGGQDIRARVRIAGATIQDQLNDAPNTCAFTMEGLPAPTITQLLRVSIGADTPRLLFSGSLQQVDTTYEGRPNQLAYHCRAVDDLARLNRIRPFGVWMNTSASQVAKDLVVLYAPGFSFAYVQEGLPLISVVFDTSEGFAGCLRQIAKLIGGYFYVEDLAVHLFITETTDAPDPIDAAHPFLHDPPITMDWDVSQVRTRVYGKGHGEAIPTDIATGETILPVADAVMFDLAGGQAVTGVTPDGGQAVRLTYTGVDPGGGGTVVGPGVYPSAAMTVGAASGAGIENGVHTYAYTWATGSGETPPSALVSITHGPVPGPTLAPVFSSDADASPYAIPAYVPGDTVDFCYTWGLAPSQDWFVTGQHTLPSPVMSHVAVAHPLYPSKPRSIVFLVQYSSDPRVKVVYVWRRVNGGAWQGMGANYNILPPTTTYTYLDQAGPQIAFGGIPAPNVAVNQTLLSGIAIGPSGTTSRKVYRTVAGGSQLKLQQTIANNTATTGVTDATPDASLGANAPTLDTSGIVLTAGQVNAGSTTLLAASSAPFAATGGWVILTGAQVVRYAGISGNSLTGIPASGAGSILTTVMYGTPVVPAPALLGVTGINQPIMRGAHVAIWVQRDDLAAQAYMRDLDAAQGIVSDGVYEGPVVIDERRAVPSLTALCDAELFRYSRPIITVNYATRDLKTKSGKTVAFNLSSPPIGGMSLTIQDVTITQIDIAKGLAPKFSVVASTVRFSLEDILRQLMTARGISDAS